MGNQKNTSRTNKPAPPSAGEAAAYGKQAAERHSKERSELIASSKSKYKNILWIDDMNEDFKSDETPAITDYKEKTDEEKLKWLNDFGKVEKNDKLKASDVIDLVTDFSDAVDIITRNDFQYDLVIFDMDLRDGITYGKNMPLETALKVMQRHNITLDDKDLINNSDVAGLWLYNLLLTVGYPIDRMVICTGNGKEKINTKTKEDLVKFDFTKNIKPKSSIDKLKTEEEFFPKGGYYRVRRLVFQAYDYWERKLNDDEWKNDFKKIPFNKCNELIDPNKNLKGEVFANEIPVGSLSEMLGHIKMLFSKIKPNDPRKIYYEAAKVVSQFHESKAPIKQLKKEAKIFHGTVRYFRNWSAHDHFGSALMDAESFALLFCIALRKYFAQNDWYFEDKNSEDKMLLYCEECYFGYDLKIDSDHSYGECREILRSGGKGV